jgi:ferredoxin--NADP+ reductase
VRWIADLAYEKAITEVLPSDEFVGELAAEQLIYYPTVTREPFRHQGRITALMTSHKIFEDVGLAPMHTEADRFMLCGSPRMIQDVRELLDARGFLEGNHGEAGHYVVEKAFVDR